MEAALKQGIADKVVVDLGVKAPTEIAYRRDIDFFLLDDPVAFNLYLLALRKLQTQSDALGFFQIAGIHGLPARDWDGVRGPQLQFTAGGYCTHGLMVRHSQCRCSNANVYRHFRRGIVLTCRCDERSSDGTNSLRAQMEQALINAAIDIAKKDFPSSTIYQQAAKRVRAPFWDPYRPRAGAVSFPGVGGTTSFPYDFKLPRILTEQNISVLMKASDTKMTQIQNPLFRFDFPSSGGLSTQEWSWLRSATRQQVR